MTALDSAVSRSDDGPAPPPHVATSKYDELWRPRFHYFAAPHMMDPAAIFEANGLWHLFHDAFRDPLIEIPEWSHATSPDAVHWVKHKVAVPRGVPGACECSNGLPRPAISPRGRLTPAVAANRRRDVCGDRRRRREG